MTPLNVLIMAAGKGTRLKSSQPKVLHLLAGQSLIEYVLETIRALNINETMVIVGHQAELVKSRLQHLKIFFIEQTPQLGTGHAVQVAQEWWGAKPGNLLILSGDVPLISSKTLERLVKTHNKKNSGVTLLTTNLTDPSGYGRIIRSSNGEVLDIIEQKDAGPSEKKINEINTGLYCFKISDLKEVINELSNDNPQKEYYLTDCIGLLSKNGVRVETVHCDDYLEVMGINTQSELATMEKFLRDQRINNFRRIE